MSTDPLPLLGASGPACPGFPEARLWTTIPVTIDRPTFSSLIPACKLIDSDWKVRK